jgi:hypothetical protein
MVAIANQMTPSKISDVSADQHAAMRTNIPYLFPKEAAKLECTTTMTAKA